MSSLNNNNFSSSLGPGSSTNKKFTSGKEDNKQEVVSITYEEIGLFPRSFSRVLDRFLKQIFADVENLVIQEYRFYRYLFLTTLKCVLILVFVPLFVNLIAKTYVVRPLTEYFWNTKQSEIFLNSYQQKRAFSELKEFEEKTYFESLVFPKSVFKPNLHLSSLELPDDSICSPSLSVPLSSESVSQLKMENKEDLLSTNSFAPRVRSVLPWSFVDQPNQESIKQKGSIQQMNGLQQSCSSLSDIQNNIQTLVKDETSVNNFELTKSPSKSSSMSSSMGPSINNSQDKKESSFVDGENGMLSKMDDYKQTELLINSYTMKSSLFVYQTQEADKTIQQRYQEKTIELAHRYNDQSIEAITNFFADLLSLFTLLYLLYVLEIQINITKSFLLEVFFGLDDSKKSLLILLITDLLVGYHSSNLWELFFEFLFHHYGLPENQTGIFLLVATLPVLLDVLFKYLIFRHLNRSSPATVATYHAMIE
jgi:hypothetical protein